MLVPWSVLILVGTGPYVGSYSVYSYWTFLVDLRVGSSFGISFFLLPFEFTGIIPSFLVRQAAAFLAEFVLIVSGFLLLSKGRRLGGIAFVLASLIEVGAYLYSVAFHDSVSVGVILQLTDTSLYYVPIGIVLSAIVGIGSLALTRRPEQLTNE
jgi:hypothetical protein